MLSDLIKEEFEAKLLIAVYLCGVIITCLIMTSQYLTGMYVIFLSNLFILLSFVFGVFYVLLLRNQRSFFYVVYPIGLILSLITLWQIAHHPNQQLQLFYVTPIFFFFYLPLKKILALGLVVVIASFMIISIKHDLMQGLRVSIHYLLVFISGYFFVSHLLANTNKLKEKSLMDTVSFAYKESRYHTLLEREFVRSRTENHELSLIGIVIGDYKQLQELNGRKALIQFLPEFVNEIQSRVRVADDVFRVEDDKFIIMLPHCPEDGASVLMERTINNFQQRQWPPFADIILMAASVTLNAEESHSELSQRLNKKLEKQKRSSKTISAIESDISEAIA